MPTRSEDCVETASTVSCSEDSDSESEVVRFRLPRRFFFLGFDFAFASFTSGTSSLESDSLSDLPVALLVVALRVVALLVCLFIFGLGFCWRACARFCWSACART